MQTTLLFSEGDAGLFFDEMILVSRENEDQTKFSVISHIIFTLIVDNRLRMEELADRACRVDFEETASAEAPASWKMDTDFEPTWDARYIDFEPISVARAIDFAPAFVRRGRGLGTGGAGGSSGTRDLTMETACSPAAVENTL